MTYLISMMCAGLALHFFKRMWEAETLSNLKAWFDFWASDVPRSITCILGAVIAFVGLVEYFPEHMNGFTAAMCGYGGNSMAKTFNQIIAAINDKIQNYISRV